MIFLLYILLLIFFICSLSSILSIYKDDMLPAIITKITVSIAIVLLFVIGYILYKASSQHPYSIHIFTFFYLVILFLTVLILYMQISLAKNDFRSLSAILIPILTIFIVISLFFYGSPRYMTVEPQHSFMVLHIMFALLGEVLFFLAFASSVLYIVVTWQLQKKSSMKFINRFPNLELLNKLTMFAISRSFAFFSIGIFLGIIMLLQVYNNISLGSPKEIIMYSAWGIIFILWIIGRSRIVNNYRLSIITIAAFIILCLLFIATNVVITTGFHSFR